MTDIEHAINDAFVKVFGNKFRLAEKAPALQGGKLPRRIRMAAKFPKDLEINSRAWRDQVAMKLLDGYGVEDIALWLKCHVSHVQAEVKHLRAAGTLQAWWGRE